MKKTAIFLSLFFINNVYGYVDNQHMCDTVPTVIEAVFIPDSYTCDAGYFLPANTDGCRACPNGYTCVGGTFYFNDTETQGLTRVSDITQDAINACAVNFPHIMDAVFDKNETITVNFNNGESVETITCTYGDDLTLPETPTRVGYVFAGWKVHTEE